MIEFTAFPTLAVPPLALGESQLPQGVAIRTTDLTIRYGDHAALRSVDLHLRRRRITSLIGPSGCGKSSLLLSLNRLTDVIAGCRVTGVIQLEDCCVTDQATDLQELRRRTGMIFQRPTPFPFSIARNFQIPLIERGIRDRGRQLEIMERALSDVGIWDELKDRLQESALRLSGGQQQRLCLARALALDPEILLLDEPCSALDPHSTAQIEELVLELRSRMTILIVTHNLAQARRISDEVAFFWADGGGGRVVEFGPTERVFGDPVDALTRSYITGQAG